MVGCIQVSASIAIVHTYMHVPPRIYHNSRKLLHFFSSESSVKVFSAKFCGCTCIIIGQEQSVKVSSTKFSFSAKMRVFFLESFLLYGIRMNL